MKLYVNRTKTTEPKRIESVKVTNGEGPDGDYSEPRSEFAWMNHAGIEFDRERDEVTVWISVDDPRGWFSMRLHRVPDDSESEYAGRIIMDVPHPDAARLNAPLVPLGDVLPGKYTVRP